MSPNTLSLSINGQERELFLSNNTTDTLSITNVTAEGFPAGTMITTDSCSGYQLIPQQSCIIQIKPGQNASSNCATGILPTPSTVTVTAQGESDTYEVRSNVLILTYGCIHQGGFLFSIDDNTFSLSSISGKVAALSDISYSATTQWQWGLYGTDVGSPTWETNTSGINDGWTNTIIIDKKGGAPCSPNNPTSSACLCSILSVNQDGSGGLDEPCTPPVACFNDWYLPAICELGPLGPTPVTFCSLNPTNIQNQLFEASPPIPNLGIAPATDYWSSTEYSKNPGNMAWYEDFENAGASVGWTLLKNFPLNVRCVREITLY